LHTFATVFFGLIALLWLIHGVRAGFGMASIPRLANVAPATGNDLPRISILFGARDEAEKISAAIESWLALDYPDFEIIAVDDRSQDATGAILDDFARRDRRLQVIHVSKLPEGWLGKPNALQIAYSRSSGEWIVFTDADVRFSPDLLRRTMALARAENWDHMTLLAALELRGFWEVTTVGYLGLGFALGFQPWKVSDSKSDTYFGVGAFQLVRRSAYQAIGTHRRLAMEVVDDIKLGKLIKLGRFRSGIATSQNFVQIRWHDGFSNLVQGLMKNLFAGYSYSVWRALLSIVAVFIFSVLPFVAICFTSGIARLACAVICFVAVLIEGRFVQETHEPALYGLTHPIGAAVFIYMSLRATIGTLWRGGIIWRGTFYPLKELRKGMV
jgi:glycosyltransferase involved in cell wall biosynthesis